MKKLLTALTAVLFAAACGSGDSTTKTGDGVQARRDSGHTTPTSNDSGTDGPTDDGGINPAPDGDGGEIRDAGNDDAGNGLPDGGDGGETADAGDGGDAGPIPCLTDCDDEVECTDDVCEQGECQHLTLHGRCQQGTICDTERGCVSPPVCATAADCPDLDGPCLREECNVATATCVYTPRDFDEDGHSPQICTTVGGDDCDDSNREINPDQTEICDGEDNDCDGTRDQLSEPCGTDEGECIAGVSVCIDGIWSDCQGEVGPSEDICDGKDNDCDGTTDRDQITHFVLTEECTPAIGECTASVSVCQNGEWSECFREVGPSEETCNNLDDDCDGNTDQIRDLCLAAIGECSVGYRACTYGSWSLCVREIGPSQEVCDNLDNDCDGQTDNVLNNGDNDNDGYPAVACGGLDCDDTNWYIYPNAGEICNGLDDNCDGTVDNGLWCEVSDRPSLDTGNNPSIVAVSGKVIIWGGDGWLWNQPQTNTGWIYDPNNDSWRSTSTQWSVPQGRIGHVALAIGDQMIVWGGYAEDENDQMIPLNSGAIYDPTRNSWTEISSTNAPPALDWYQQVAVVGENMFVWGTTSAAPLTPVGRIYNKTTNTWSTMNMTGIQIGAHPVVVNQKIIVWKDSGTAAYDPMTNQWITLATTNQPSERRMAVVVSAGTQLIVWGGVDSNNNPVNNGGVYDTATNSWHPMSTDGAPSYRHRPPPQSGQSAFWLDSLSQILFWAGVDYLYSGLYNPNTDTWSQSPFGGVGSTSRNSERQMVWTGEWIVNFVGLQARGYVGGYRYRP